MITKKQAEDIDCILGFFHRLPGVFTSGEISRLDGNDFVQITEELYLRHSKLHQYFSKQNNYDEITFENSLKRLSSQQRFAIFAVIIHKLIDSGTGSPSVEAVSSIAQLKNLFSIDIRTYTTLLTFLKAKKPLADTFDSLYVTDVKASPLIGLGGPPVIRCLHRDDETHYFKHVAVLNTFLTKLYRRQIIGDTIAYTETAGVFWSSTALVGGLYYELEELQKRLKNHSPLQSIEIDQTESNPKIILSVENGNIHISGRSIGFSSTQFLEPILDWLELYRTHGKLRLSINISLEIYNTYSARFFMRMFMLIKEMQNNGLELSVNWYYLHDDEDMLEFASMIQQICAFNFNFFPVKTFANAV